MLTPRLTPFLLAGAFAAGTFSTTALQAQRSSSAPVADRSPEAAPDTAAFRALQWRNIGPMRGGRSVAVTGIPGRPLTFLAGYTGGGVWRTDDAGLNWRNISDGWFGSGSIGAIAVAPSDENVIYVGTGEHAVRGQSSTYGDGVYRSTDQGRTWSHRGLAATRQISAVRVHPRNPELVYVAAQGDRWKGTPERGIYRSADGGESWELVLEGANATSGASDLSMDPTNPRILYAAFWDNQRVPWQVRSGGPGSGLWKSTDGGDTWTRLSRGLPGLMGKIGVAVSPADPDRVYAIVEADKGGLYRSDDAGLNWRRLSDDRLIQTRSWYYMKVIADPANADVVWVLNAPVLRSIDGGRTFQTVKATHGDNHSLWIDPTDSRVMINGNDGGASVTLDGGKSWSTQDNQPTAQFYHLAVDDAFPYRLYGGQQDNSSVIIRSRGDGGSIDVRDWRNGPGCESANIGVNARDPRLVYGGCYQGIIDELDQETGLSRTIMPWPAMNLTEPTDRTRYRFNWTAPIVVSQHDAGVVYHGGNVLFRTTDRGQSWLPISPDLTRDDSTRQGWGGVPITNEGAGGEVYGTIVVIHESPHDARTIYVGTDDGNVQLTRDGGTTWVNITPPSVRDGLVNEIEVSPHDAATAYVAFRTDRLGDPTPHIFRTTDYGRSWTRLVNGLRANQPVRVVREDGERRGLLYAGTETGVYLSWDAGAHWQPLPAPFPAVPVTDLAVRHGALIASTEGRAFWIMDDLSPIRQHADSLRTVTAHLYVPQPAIRLATSGGGGSVGPGTVGRNPAPGATLFYRLGSAPDSAMRVTLEILDGRGSLVRSFSTDTAGGIEPLEARDGLNTFAWNLRRSPPTRLANVVLFGSPSGGGALVSPGTYQVRLTAGNTVRTQPLEVRQDPRLDVPATAMAARDSAANALAGRISEIHDLVLQLRDTRDQVKDAMARAGSAPNAATIRTAGNILLARLDSLEPRLTTRATNGQDIINFPNGINGQFGFLLGQVEGNPVLTAPARERSAELLEEWERLRAEVDAAEGAGVDAFNRLLEEGNVPGVAVKRRTAAPIS